MSDTIDEANDRANAHAKDFEALVWGRIEGDEAAASVVELLFGLAYALNNTIGAGAYVVPVSASRYALAVDGVEVITVKVEGDMYAVETSVWHLVVPVGNLKAVLSEALLNTLPVFVHAAARAA